MKKIAITLLVLLIPAALLAYLTWSGFFHPYAEKDYELRTSVPGAFNLLARQLEEDGMVANKKLFRALAILTRSDKKLQSVTMNTSGSSVGGSGGNYVTATSVPSGSVSEWPVRPYEFSSTTGQ